VAQQTQDVVWVCRIFLVPNKPETLSIDTQNARIACPIFAFLMASFEAAVLSNQRNRTNLDATKKNQTRRPEKCSIPRKLSSLSSPPLVDGSSTGSATRCRTFNGGPEGSPFPPPPFPPGFGPPPPPPGGRKGCRGFSSAVSAETNSFQAFEENISFEIHMSNKKLKLAQCIGDVPSASPCSTNTVKCSNRK
jgi:hypothetical protein